MGAPLPETLVIPDAVGRGLFLFVGRVEGFQNRGGELEPKIARVTLSPYWPEVRYPLGASTLWGQPGLLTWSLGVGVPLCHGAHFGRLVINAPSLLPLLLRNAPCVFVRETVGARVGPFRSSGVRFLRQDDKLDRCPSSTPGPEPGWERYT